MARLVAASVLVGFVLLAAMPGLLLAQEPAGAATVAESIDGKLEGFDAKDALVKLEDGGTYPATPAGAKAIQSKIDFGFVKLKGWVRLHLDPKTFAVVDI